MSVGIAVYHCAIGEQMSDSKARNLEAIQAALDLHSEHCLREPLAVAMNPYEVERLGWEEFRGLPIVADPDIGTGRVRVICEEQDSGAGLAGLELIYEDFPEEVIEPEIPAEGPEEINAIRRMLDRYGR